MLEVFTLKPQAFGLDISDLSLKIAQLTKQHHGYRLTTFGEFSIPVGVIERGEVKQEERLTGIIRSSLSNLEGEKLQTKYVVVSLPEEKAFLQMLQFPRMNAEELSEAVRFEAENYIPYSIDKVYLDFQIVLPLHNHLDHLDVLLASLAKDVIDPYVSVLQKAGLTPVVLEVESLAISRALVKGGVTPSPILIMDMGATRTGLNVFSGYSSRFTASIPISAEHFTHGIEKALSVEKSEAEQLKIQHGLSGREDSMGRKVFEALIPSITDFIEQMRKYIIYYESHMSHQHLRRPIKDIRKILLCGGGANLKGLPEFLTKELKIETVVGNPWHNILPPSLKELPPIPFQDSIRYTTALGLALRGANQELTF
ncbi:type IV pilus assembly protein PilM [Patescibacteria group bacterium]|nr:type IV pilus assembly protein PilM [Patescibacteria group bacterium]